MAKQRDTAQPGRPTVRPGVMYEDVNAAYDFLTDVFGFEGGLKIGMDGAEGPIHCDVWAGDQCIMLFATADWNPTAMPPKNANGTVTQMIHVDVPDLKAQYDQIVAKGGEVGSEPFDMFYGDQIFWATDCEGHAWAFHSSDFKAKAPEAWTPFHRIDD